MEAILSHAGVHPQLLRNLEGFSQENTRPTTAVGRGSTAPAPRSNQLRPLGFCAGRSCFLGIEKRALRRHEPPLAVS